jgi:hypothetical protein
MTQRIHQLLVFLSLSALLLTRLPPAYAQSPVNTVAITHLGATAEPDGEVQVTAVVSVFDAEGQVVGGLTAADFSVVENASPIEPYQVSVAVSDAPLDVALLLDISSGSAQPGPTGIRAIDSMKDAAIGLIEGLAEGDQVAVYRFNGQLQLEQELTYDHNLAIDQGVAKLDGLNSPEVCLYDALLQAIERMGEDEIRRKAIVVFTGSNDGVGAPTCSGKTADDVVDRLDADARSVPIYSVAYGTDIDPEALARLARRSGGYSTIGADPTLLIDLTRRVSVLLQNQYKVIYSSQAPDSLSQVTITENSSQQSDRRQVFIPPAVEPTPTPVPQFSMGLTVNQPSGSQLEVLLEIPAEVTLTKTELFINDELAQRAVEPPFDRFEIDILELGSGKQSLRVEATDINGTLATSQVELTLTIPPTPVPTVVPTPQPTVTPETSVLSSLSETGGLSTLAIALIGAGFVILVILLSVIAYLLYAQSKRSAAMPVQSAPEPLSRPEGSQETMLDIERDTPPNLGSETLLDLEVATPAVRPSNGAAGKAALGRAKLVVITGRPILDQPEYVLNKPEVKIGRNSAGKMLNDIGIKDREVSRAHAKITYRNQEFFIQDSQSSTGTLVNGVKLSPFQDAPLKHNTEIAIGPNVKFRFEVIDSKATELDFKLGSQWPGDAEDADRTIFEQK